MEQKEKEVKEKKEQKITLEDVELIFLNSVKNRVDIKEADTAFSKVKKEVLISINETNKDEYNNSNHFTEIYEKFLEILGIKDYDLWHKVESNIFHFLIIYKTINILKQIPGEYGQIIHYFLLDIMENLIINIKYIISNPNVHMNILIKFYELNEISYETGDSNNRISNLDNLISENPSITIDDIKKNKNIKWNYDLLSSNKNMNWKFILDTMKTVKYNKLESKMKWNFELLSSNPIINFDIVKKYPKYKWFYGNLSTNPNITLKIIRENPNPEWNYLLMGSNPGISLKDLLDSKEVKREIKQVHFYKSDIIGQYSVNKKLTIKDVLDKKYYDDLESEEISVNAGISIKDIMKNPQIFWDLENTLRNPNMTFKTLIENKHIFDYNIESILRNEYNGKHKEDVKFPKFWLIVNYLYFELRTKEKEEKMYKIAELIYNKINELIENILLTNKVPDVIILINRSKDLRDLHTMGIIQYAIEIIKDETKYDELEDPSDFVITNLYKAYKKLGGIEIHEYSEIIDKKQCINELDPIYVTEDIKDIEENKLITFELEGKTYCYPRQILIDFWNQEENEHNESNAFNFGDCEFEIEEDENGEEHEIANEDTCEKFYKIPITIEGLDILIRISEIDKNRIVENTDIRKWKLVKDRIVKMGRQFHYYGEDNEERQIYGIKGIVKYKKL
jgi:hypothetical protein